MTDTDDHIRALEDCATRYRALSRDRRFGIVDRIGNAIAARIVDRWLRKRVDRDEPPCPGCPIHPARRGGNHR